MRVRILAIAATAAGLLLLTAACDGQTEPSPPPTTPEALPTATATPSPSPDDVDATTEAAPTEAALTTEEPRTDEPTTAEPTTEDTAADEGPPVMPDEALEQTYAGAEAFALHYIDLVNYTGKYPTLGLLEPLAQETCRSCANRVEAVEYAVEHGDYLRGDTFLPEEPLTIMTSDTARVAIPLVQPAQDYYRGDNVIDRRMPAEEATLVIRMDWEGRWLISGITVEP